MAVSVSEGVSPSNTANPNAMQANEGVCPSTKSNKHHSDYIMNPGSSTFQSDKWQKGINGNVYFSKITTPNHPIPTSPLSNNIGMLSRTFSSILEKSDLFMEGALQAFLVMDNKEDTLAQSHMLQANDRNKFIAAQVPEICGLEKMPVFEVHPQSSLPQQAKLLSSIWSYCQKRWPNGELIKHKARICVDGLQ
jgi:hypothetical protein